MELGSPLDGSLVSLSEVKTLASSNFKKVYKLAKCPEHQHQLMGNVWELVRAYANHHSIGQEAAKKFFDELQQEAFGSEDALKEILGNIPSAAQRLWTSGKTLVGGSRVRQEFCSMINFVLRMDWEDSMAHAVSFVRAVNQLSTVMGVRNVLQLPFPPGGVLWRGGSLPNQYQDFFQIGVKYRAPVFLASSMNVKVANHFIFLATQEDEPTVRWKILLNPKGEEDFNWRCKNVNLVSKSHFGDSESEFLFIPYSPFEVVEVCWSDQATNGRFPHEITIRAALDSLDEPEDLPLAPWH